MKIVLMLCSFLFIQIGNAQVFYAGVQPDKAKIGKEKNNIDVQNNVLKLTVEHNQNDVNFDITDLQLGKDILIQAKDVFQLSMEDGSHLYAKDFELNGAPNIQNALGKKSILFHYLNKRNAVSVTQNISLKDSDNFIRINYLIHSEWKKIANFQTMKIARQYQPNTIGLVDGSPLFSSNIFFTIENPMFTIDTLSGSQLELIAPSDSIDNKNFSVDVVFGVCPEQQIRRGFLYYLERSRARKYAPFLHYNSWFDLSYNADTLKESDCLDRMQYWIDSLVVKRKIRLDGFLWDSGWDDFTKLWNYNSYFPRGFSRMAAYGKKYNAAMGVWISPWGGYDDAVVLRKKNAKIYHAELETNENGFTLAGSHYYHYFLNTANRFIGQDNVHIFKFDGVGAGLKATGPGAEFKQDIESFLHIIHDLRSKQPNTYFSLTVGTWPSPMWLKFGDNIWRGGDDMGMMGDGNNRQKWMNYRDAVTYKNIVKKAPLYPLNAVMNHGITIATKGLPSKLENDLTNLTDDFWTFFANGTSLQEMYVNPHLLDGKAWDSLANTIHWAQKNKGVLIDSHWYGGDPANGDIYGYASWNPKLGILLLRNPSNKIKSTTLDLQSIFEIPINLQSNFTCFDVRKNKVIGREQGGKMDTITLQPYEVLVLEFRPQK
ncbi:hypothetical protein [Rhizosphaericola mali]|uniref:Enterotoxin n=1 Tax=Rhizosphaericola mali TaxID=2545455 RepID=A0A5P2G7Z9_9BACT|nr:hypothetical protein [Rhizosphaericola mali]QES89880.1 hypothetical protein E0W69_014850 [Rhizosphaericola mali]